MSPASFSSVPDVCDVEVISSSRAEPTTPRILIEVPHGATAELHYQTLRARLSPSLPGDLKDFFFVNTDVGSTEYARQVAQWIAQPDDGVLDLLGGDARVRVVGLAPRQILLVRCLIPRTFIDTNRIIDGSAPEGMTAAIAEYVRDPKDGALLTDLHEKYQQVVAAAYEQVCGSGGWALTPHSYAPRSIQIDTFDEGIGKALRAAYEPERYTAWPMRPEVDLITEAPDETRLAPPALVTAMIEKLGRVGIEAAQNSTYRLHTATMGHRYSARYPGRVLCMEVRRDLLADPFDPFAEMRIGKEKVARIARPIAAAFLEQLVTP